MQNQNLPEWPSFSLPGMVANFVLMHVKVKGRRKSHHIWTCASRRSSCMVQWGSIMFHSSLYVAGCRSQQGRCTGQMWVFHCQLFRQLYHTGQLILKSLRVWNYCGYYISAGITAGQCHWKRLHSMDACHFRAYCALNSSNEKLCDIVRLCSSSDRATFAATPQQNTFPGHDGRWSDRQ